MPCQDHSRIEADSERSPAGVSDNRLPVPKGLDLPTREVRNKFFFDRVILSEKPTTPLVAPHVSSQTVSGSQAHNRMRRTHLSPVRQLCVGQAEPRAGPWLPQRSRRLLST